MYWEKFIPNTVAFGNTTLHMQPYTVGHADKPEVTSGGMCAVLV